jgi:hypothetical protein
MTKICIAFYESYLCGIMSSTSPTQSRHKNNPCKHPILNGTKQKQDKGARTVKSIFCNEQWDEEEIDSL